MTLLGHTFSLESVCWSPNGKQLASSSMDGTCRIWDVERGECAFVMSGEESKPTTQEAFEPKQASSKSKYVCELPDVSWNPKHDVIAMSCSTNSTNRGIIIWNPNSGELVAKLSRDAETESVEFTADGRRLILGDNRGTCAVLDTDTWKTQFEFEAHRGTVKSIAANPNNSSFATCGTDGAIHIWSLTDAHKLSTLNGHDASVNSIAWDPTGRQLVSGSSDHRVKIWNVAESRAYNRISIDSEKASTIDWEPSPLRLRCTTNEGTVASLDIKSGLVEKITTEHSWFDDGKASNEARIAAHLELAAQNKVAKSKQFVHKKSGEREYGFCWSADRAQIAIISHIGDSLLVDAWSALDKRHMQQWSILSVNDAQWAPDNRRLAVAGGGQIQDGGFKGWSGWIYIYDAETGKTIHKLQHGSERVLASAVAWDPTGSFIVSGNVGGLVCIWDAIQGKLLANATVHQTRINSLAWSPDQKRIAAAGIEGQVKILEAKTCDELLSLGDTAHSVTQLAWSPDGRQLAGIDSDGSIVVWDASKG